MSLHNNRGVIEVIFGPMFSGKSTELMRRVNRWKISKKKCLVINYAGDSRYTDEAFVATHDLLKLQATKVPKLDDIAESYKNFDVVAIDEAQFFNDIAEKAEIYANAGKIVIVAALDATFERKPFGNILALVPIAERLTKLSAVCADCQYEASFTSRTTESKEIELIGGDDIYKPTCRTCFFRERKIVDHEETDSMKEGMKAKNDNSMDSDNECQPKSHTTEGSTPEKERDEKIEDLMNVESDFKKITVE